MMTRCRPAQSVALLSAFLGLWVAQSAVGAPPRIPAEFDAATVGGLVAQIDQGENAKVLEAAFVKHGVAIEQRQHVMKALKQDLATEPVNGERWMLAEMLIGFGGFRLQDADTGRTAYSTIFGHEATLARSGRAKLVSRAVYEMLEALPNCFPTGNAPQPIEELLGDAAACQFAVGAQNVDGSLNYRWRDAVECCVDCKLLVARIKTLTSPRDVDLSPALAEMVGQIYDGAGDPGALAWYQRATRPLSGGKVSDAYYGSLVDYLVRSGKKDQAIAVQNDRVKAEGAGLGRLALMYYDVGKKSQFQSVLADLAQPNVEEGDVLTAGVYLLRRGADSPDRVSRACSGENRFRRSVSQDCVGDRLWHRRAETRSAQGSGRHTPASKWNCIRKRAFCEGYGHA